jgi:FixJ family two-component response regulator
MTMDSLFSSSKVVHIVDDDEPVLKKVKVERETQTLHIFSH